jgi:hypothetical protein
MRGSSEHLRRKVLTSLIVLTIGATLSLIVPISGAVAATERGTASSTAASVPTIAVAIPHGWFAFTRSRPANSRLKAIQGTKGSDGQCRYNLKQTAKPGDVPKRLDELARDLTTCESLFAVTPLSPQEAKSRPTGLGQLGQQSARTASTGSVAPTNSARGAGVKPNTVYYDGAYIYAWWEDPVGITVNSLESDLWWYEDGSCASLGDWYGNSTWYTPSGWSRDYAYSNGGQNGCEYAYDNTTAHFYNHSFCAFSSTDTYYYQDEVDGWYDGSFTVEWNTNTLGSCSYLLSVHEQWGYL